MTVRFAAHKHEQLAPGMVIGLYGGQFLIRPMMVTGTSR